MCGLPRSESDRNAPLPLQKSDGLPYGSDRAEGHIRVIKAWKRSRPGAGQVGSSPGVDREQARRRPGADRERDGNGPEAERKQTGSGMEADRSGIEADWKRKAGDPINERRECDDNLRVRVDEISRFARAILASVGVPQPNADTLSDVLVHADMQGIFSHGMSRLPTYAARIERGLINPRTSGSVVTRRGAVRVIDGENGIGQVLGVRAMQDAIDGAGEHGVGIVGVRRSNHFGVAGYYAELGAEMGMIGIALTNSPKGIPPWGGREAYFGTNPIAAAIPVPGRLPIVIDLATSVTARGDIILAAQRGEPIPKGWAIDSEGRPTTDAQAALTGAVLPMAGPKGYALALLVEVLTGVLTGAAFGPHVLNMYEDWTQGSEMGHLFIAIDPAAFGDPAFFLDRMETMAREIEAVPPASGATAPRLPGERRHASAIRARKEGISYSPSIWAALERLGLERGVPLP